MATIRERAIKGRKYFALTWWKKVDGQWKKQYKHLPRAGMGPGFADFLLKAVTGGLPTHDLEKLLERKARFEAKDRAKHEPQTVKLPDGKPQAEDWQKWISEKFSFENARYESIEAAVTDTQRQAQAIYDAANREPTAFQAPRDELLAKAAKFDTQAMVLGATMREAAPVAPSEQTLEAPQQSEEPELELEDTLDVALDTAPSLHEGAPAEAELSSEPEPDIDLSEIDASDLQGSEGQDVAEGPDGL